MDPLESLHKRAEAKHQQVASETIREATSESLRTHGYIAHSFESFMEANHERIQAVASSLPVLFKHHREELFQELQKSSSFTGMLDDDALMLSDFGGLRDSEGEIVVFSAARDNWGGYVEDGRWQGSYRRIEPIITMAAFGPQKGFHFSLVHDLMMKTSGNQMQGTEASPALIDELVRLSEIGSIDPYSYDDNPEVTPLPAESIVAKLHQNITAVYDACLTVLKRNYGS